MIIDIPIRAVTVSDFHYMIHKNIVAITIKNFGGKKLSVKFIFNFVPYVFCLFFGDSQKTIELLNKDTQGPTSALDY